MRKAEVGETNNGGRATKDVALKKKANSGGISTHLLTTITYWRKTGVDEAMGIYRK